MTRMWMVNPKTMCHRHLLGEHKEIHQLIGHLKKKRSITGYIRNNCLELTSICSRHDLLVEEMKRRGWPSGIKHIHIMPIPIDWSISYLPDNEVSYKVDIESSCKDLYNRCVNCNKLGEALK